jgi:hypothetical protein
MAEIILEMDFDLNQSSTEPSPSISASSSSDNSLQRLRDMVSSQYRLEINKDNTKDDNKIMCECENKLNNKTICNKCNNSYNNNSIQETTEILGPPLITPTSINNDNRSNSSYTDITLKSNRIKQLKPNQHIKVEVINSTEIKDNIINTESIEIIPSSVLDSSHYIPSKSDNTYLLSLLSYINELEEDKIRLNENLDFVTQSLDVYKEAKVLNDENYNGLLNELNEKDEYINGLEDLIQQKDTDYDELVNKIKSQQSMSKLLSQYRKS